MSKAPLIRQRRLSKQQTRRIKAQQETMAETLSDTDLLEGIVVGHFGKQLDVQVLSLPQQQTAPVVAVGEPEPFWQQVTLNDIWRCHARTNLPMLATGDYVKWTADSNTGLGRIEIIEPRSNLIVRPDRYHKLKPVAANIDLVGIVVAVEPTPSAEFIDRYLVVCHHYGVMPLIILNKSDLATSHPDAYASALTLLQRYRDLGYHTQVTNIYESLISLEPHIHGKKVILVGQSGVGKSSLINRLLPESEQQVQQISTASRLGQHTTSASRLLPFDKNNIASGALIDSPGIRSYGLWHLEPEDILAGFTELAPLAQQCRFRDCQHLPKTPGCALQQGLKEGVIAADRVANMLKLRQEATTDEY